MRTMLIVRDVYVNTGVQVSDKDSIIVLITPVRPDLSFVNQVCVCVYDNLTAPYFAGCLSFDESTRGHKGPYLNKQWYIINSSVGTRVEHL